MRDARILIFDLEVAPIEGKAWPPKWDTNMLEVDEVDHLLAVGYMWLGDDEATVVSLPDFPRNYRRNRRDDSRLAKLLADLFEEADVVVAHNGRSFDWKVGQTRMAANGLTAPAPKPMIDTRLVIRREFRLYSNSLDDAAHYFGLGSKLTHTGWHLWSQVLKNDPEAWETMVAYCKIDVELLAKLYLFLRNGGWIRNHPNLAVITERPDVCPHCGADSHELVVRGHRRTATYAYTQYRCNVCGSYSRSRTRDKVVSAPDMRP